MQPVNSVTGHIIAEQRDGLTILSPALGKPTRRVFYVNSYGMAAAWRSIQQGLSPGHHLWGCLELVKMGYTVAMPEENSGDSRFFNYRRQDLKWLRFVKSWLGHDGILYSGHTILFWTPLLVELKCFRCPVISMLYARGENLRFSGGYRGLVALTPAARERAKDLAPHSKVVHLGWGVDLPFFPHIAYHPQWFLTCGKTRRDFKTMAAAAATHSACVRVINTAPPPGVEWPANVDLVTTSTKDWRAVSYADLLHQHYAGCAAALIILEADPTERFAAGFTQLLEAMAVGRPVIVTKTGALPGEIDVEKEGCGLFVPPNNSAALADAMQVILQNPERAAAMGQRGRAWCETRYNIVRYANELHEMFDAL